VGNSPTNFTDPSGNIPLDEIADVAFIAYDLYQLALNPNCSDNQEALGLDLLGLSIPYATGLGAANRARRAAEVASVGSGFAAKGASWGLSFAKTKAALSSAQEAYKGSTVVGHALSKHAPRNPEVWGTMTGSMKTWNEQGMAHLREVIRGPGEFEKQTYDNGLTFMEKRLLDGRGVRLNMDGTFKGFLD
jgi:hypothetical protein